MSRVRRVVAGLRPEPAPDVVTGLRLPRGEHRATWALTADGGAVVLSDAGLRRVAADGAAGELLEWVHLDRGVWEPPWLLVEPAPVGSRPVEPWTVELPDPRDVPRQVRVRVDATIVWSGRTRLAGAPGAVRLVARRRVGGTELLWRVWPDAEVPLHDPLVRAEIERALAEAQATVGDGPDPRGGLGPGLGLPDEAVADPDRP